MSNTTNYNLFKYEDNTNADFRLGNPNMDILDTELKKVSDKANTKEIIIKNITIRKATWTMYQTGIYRNDIIDTDIKENDVVDINFSENDVLNGNTDDLFTVTTIIHNQCKVFSKSIPTVDLTATMIIQKGA